MSRVSKEEVAVIDTAARTTVSSITVLLQNGSYVGTVKGVVKGVPRGETLGTLIRDLRKAGHAVDTSAIVRADHKIEIQLNGGMSMRVVQLVSPRQCPTCGAGVGEVTSGCPTCSEDLALTKDEVIALKKAIR